MQGRPLRVVGAVVLSWVVLGCSMGPYFGIRPDEPVFTVSRATACQEFVVFAKYTQELQEAYHSRATQNRFWIYAAGTTALGTMATSAGLAAASAASFGTLALLPIAGGFASGFFAVLDNPTLADIYTIAANRLATALQESDARLVLNEEGSRYANQPACAAAHAHLRLGVTQAKIDLERARTDSAFAALQRVAAQTQRFNQLVAQSQAQAVTQAVQKGEITAIQPSEVVVGQEREFTLTVSNVNLASIGFADVKVLIGTETRSVYWTPPDPNTGNYAVKFMAPTRLPVENTLEYRPVLVVGSTQTRVESGPGVILKYKLS
jgi:hypothetical protein